MLKVQNLSFSYKSSSTLLKDISYSFDKNQIYGLVGANGAGKTTFFKLLLDQLKPQTGTISINNLNSGKDRKKYRDQFIFSVEEPQFLPYLTGMEWLLFVLASYHKKADQKKLQELIDIFSFPEIESQTEEYSHGMSKKLSMIISLMVNPYCLLFDESFAGIDPFISKKVHEYFISIKKDKIILISSHNKDLTENLFDTILFLKNGTFKIIERFDDIFDEK